MRASRGDGAHVSPMSTTGGTPSRGGSIATRRGDNGTTGLLFSDQRVAKDDLRPEAVGTVDEAVASMGVARAELHLTELLDLEAIVLKIQRELFVVGAELASPRPGRVPRSRLRGPSSAAPSDAQSRSRPATGLRASIFFRTSTGSPTSSGCSHAPQRRPSDAASRSRARRTAPGPAAPRAAAPDRRITSE